MRTQLLFPLLFLALNSVAQTAINKSVPVSAGQKVNMHFDYPELVRVSTWDKNEISIQGSVSINGGENDEAFVLETSTSDNIVSVESRINGLKNLPQRITVNQGGRKIVFKTKADYRKYCDENGKDFNMMSTGVDMDILLEIKVPQNTETRVESVYGMVEVKQFTGPLIVEATYGGVDAALLEKSTGELEAETDFGQIYSNLDVKLLGNNVRERDFHTYVSAKPGNGPRYSFESKYGNVYLRKSIK
ncbi:MAG: hypothetical protein AABY93_13525 [Bacteroidota bacterium]